MNPLGRARLLLTVLLGLLFLASGCVMLTPDPNVSPLSRPRTPSPLSASAPATAAPASASQGSPGSLLWQADMETGDLSQWLAGQGEAVFTTGTGWVTVTDQVAHCGRYALALGIQGAAGKLQAARIFRWQENPAEAYYSAWLLFPERYQTSLWWNVFQFKSKAESSQPMWVLNVGNRSNGDLVFYLWDAIRQETHHHQLTGERLSVPVGQWVHVEAFYRRAQDNSGRIAIWQDGVKIFDIDGVQTAIAENVHWSLDNYTDRITPDDPVIYADDAAISLERLGPEWKAGCGR